MRGMGYLLGGAAALALISSLSFATPGFRDLNHNGQRDPYENPQLPIDRRLDDLLGRMTLEEKVGTMMHGSLRAMDSPIGASSKGYDLAAAEHIIKETGVNSFITRLTMPAAEFARQNNAIQKIAEGSRLGIPVTISSDPRSHFMTVVGASSSSGSFSIWPETLGLAAINDPSLVRRFGDIVRQEYRAVGIHMALSPQADLATEPRWARAVGTFGSDPETVSTLAGAYIQGFQGGAKGLTPGGVATVVKHWVGYGAEPEGFDAHNYYGRIAKLDDASFALHVAAFKGAFAAGSAGVMPTYPILEGVSVNGQPLPPVAAGYSKPLLTDLLRGTYGYRGVIISDWAITKDCPVECKAPSAEKPQTSAAIAMPWGVEELSQVQRFAKGVEAGLDQFGGVDDPTALLAAVHEGRISEARIDESVRRILWLKFELGLFDDPYVDPDRANIVVGDQKFQAEADAAQRRSQVLLENGGNLLPLKPSKVWLHQVDAAVARAAGFTVVDDPAQADVVIVRTQTRSEKLHPHHFFGARQHEGRLDFRDGDADYEVIKKVAKAVPTIVVVDMDRPAILTNIKDKARALLVTFGANDAAVMDIVTGRARAEGRLPFELPSSMMAVEKQNPALPDDSNQPLYARGAGIGPRR